MALPGLRVACSAPVVVVSGLLVAFGDARYDWRPNSGLPLPSGGAQCPVGGLLLAKIPNETREERNSYFADRAHTQQDAVDNDLLRESDPSSPMLKPERSSKVTFGGGQRS